MYRRYRIFQHPWPRILFPIFTIKWKLKPGLVKLIESFLQFCISHEFKIHAFFLFALEVFILRSTAGNWDVKLEAVFKIEAALETASLCWLTSLAPLSLHFDEIFSQAKIIRRGRNCLWRWTLIHICTNMSKDICRWGWETFLPLSFWNECLVFCSNLKLIF